MNDKPQVDRADILPGGTNRFELASKSSVVTGLVDAAGSILRDMHYGLPDGGRNKDLDHVWAIVSALETLANELAELCDGIQAMPIEADS